MNAVIKPQQQTTALAPLEQLKRAMFPQIKALVPNDEAMAKSLFATAVRLASDPKIMACTQASIINCFTRAIDLGLNLDPSFGEAYFIPYKDYKNNNITELTVQLGAKGYAALAQTLGGWQIQIIPVFDCDNYSEYQDFNEHGWMETKFTLQFNQEERGKNIHNQEWCHEHLKVVIATARRKEYGEWVTIKPEPTISRNEIERRRLMSSNQKPNQYQKPEQKARLEAGKPIGIWQEHYLAMAEKTALAAIAKKLPKNRGTEKLLSIIESKDDAINSTATVIETPQVPLPAPTPAAQPQPEPIADTTPTPPPYPDQQADESIEDGSFTDVPENVDVDVDTETGEIISPASIPEPEKPRVVFTGENYVPGSISICKTNNELVEFWETVPPDVQAKYQSLFDEKQDLLRYV